MHLLRPALVLRSRKRRWHGRSPPRGGRLPQPPCAGCPPPHPALAHTHRVHLRRPVPGSPPAQPHPSVKQARLATAQPLCESLRQQPAEHVMYKPSAVRHERERKCRQARADLHEDLTACQDTLALALCLRLRLLLLLVRLPVLPPLPECLQSPEAPFAHAAKYLATFSASQGVALIPARQACRSLIAAAVCRRRTSSVMGVLASTLRRSSSISSSIGFTLAASASSSSCASSHACELHAAALCDIYSCHYHQNPSGSGDKILDARAHPHLGLQHVSWRQSVSILAVLSIWTLPEPAMKAPAL